MNAVAIKNTRSKRKKIVISSNCMVAQTVEAACEGFNRNNLCKLWEDLKIKNNERIEVSHIKDKIYFFRNKNKECLVEIPEIITKLGLNIMVEYLAKNPKLCHGCSLFERKDSCPKHLFV